MKTRNSAPICLTDNELGNSASKKVLDFRRTLELVHLQCKSNKWKKEAAHECTSFVQSRPSFALLQIVWASVIANTVCSCDELEFMMELNLFVSTSVHHLHDVSIQIRLFCLYAKIRARSGRRTPRCSNKQDAKARSQHFSAVIRRRKHSLNFG